MCDTATRKFETQSCTRCGGSGHYSYCQMYGTRCFKCSGSGKTYTKRGSAAVAFYVSLCQKRVGDVQPGELVYDEVWRKFVRVVRSGWGLTGSRYESDGVEKPYYELESERASMGYCTDDDTVRIGQSAEEKARKLNLAYDYQDSLTKAGKPRKSRAPYAATEA